MIRAVGTDLVDIPRLEGYMDRVPGLRERLFTPAELAACQKRAASLGARLAAKEAVLKALGSAYAELGLDAPQGWEYQDIEVTSTPGTPPRLRLTGAAAISWAGQAQVVGSVTSWERGRSLRSLIHPIVLRSALLAPPTRL